MNVNITICFIVVHAYAILITQINKACFCLDLWPVGRVRLVKRNDDDKIAYNIYIILKSKQIIRKAKDI